MTSVASARGSRTYRWLLVLPFVWQVALVPVVNDVSFAPLHIAFPMTWQLLGVVFTTVVIAVVFRLDRKSGVEEEAEFLAATNNSGRTPWRTGPSAIAGSARCCSGS
jgi:uncharacterized membrane protein